MPTETPIPTEPSLSQRDGTPEEPATGFAGSPAPLSFVPHSKTEPARINTKINTGRYGEMDAHELIHLLDSIEDERARGRFRESIYISVFVWIVIAWVVLYGPRYLWHAPQLVSPADALKHRDMVELNNPSLPHAMRTPAARPAPKPLDNKTIEHLKATAPKAVAPPTPQPLPATPAPVVPPPVATSPVAPRPQPPVADAPAPQPTKPNFNTSTNPGDAVRNAARDAAHSRESLGGVGGGGGGALNRFQGGVQVLSDLQGVDFTDYLRHVYNDVKRNWIPLLPEETQPPLMKQGETYVRFSIMPDGSIGEMHLDGPSGDVAIDKAAWGSIVSEGQFPPLPAKFHGPKLELRYHYIVNKRIE